MSQKFVDIHVHSTLKPFNNIPKEGACPTLWENLPQYGPDNPDPFKKLNSLVKGNIDIFRTSQANLDQCVQANLRCVFLGLYPAERKFFDAKEMFLLAPLIRIFLPKKKRKYLGAAVTGFPVRKVEGIMERISQNTGIDYFNGEYLKLIKYVVDQQRVGSPTHPYEFKIATDYDEFKNFTENGKKIITGILTVEGVCSLGNYRYHKIFDKTYSDLTSIEKMELACDFEDNIRKTKNLNNVLKTEKDYTPFFISFSHHFNNLLAGHAKSLSAIFSLVLNQKAGMNDPFNMLGFRVLNLLLSKENGRRILIDTKHMSILSRRQYHCIVKKRRLKEDFIPIICSHSAVNGLESFKKSAELDKKLFINKNAYFNRAALNLNDEEILDIFDSDGLIGLVLHEDRMPGGVVKREAKKYKKILEKYHRKKAEITKGEADEAVEKLRLIYIGLIWSNIFHIIRLIYRRRMDEGGQPANGWKIISLGSDYDGTMNPFDTFETVTSFPILAKKMIDYLENTTYPVYYVDKGERKELARSEIKKLSFGKKPEELVKNIFWNNTGRFLKKYFTDKYLNE